MKTILLLLIITISLGSIGQTKLIQKTDQYKIFIEYETIKLNDTGNFKFIVEVKQGFKIHDEYPHKANLELKGLENKGLEISVQGKKLTYDYTFKRTGEPFMKGILKFSYCTDKTMDIKRFKFEMPIPKGD